MRYIILILLNIPIIMLALVNIVTDYKLKKISVNRFRNQIFLWILILIVVIGSFPVYNILVGRPPLDSSELSLFDIVQTTIIIFLLYAINSQRQRVEQNEQRLKKLHQEISIRLSEKNN